MSNIEKILGNEYNVYPLKPFIRRLRNRLKRPQARQPAVYKVVTADDRKYKMLQAVEGNRELLRITKNIPLLKTMDCIPNIVWFDECHIILDFIEGRVPDITGGDFAKSFGDNLARLHDLNVNIVPLQEVTDEAKENIDFLVSKGALNGNVAALLIERLKSLQPKHIRKSIVYANLSQKNFVFGLDRKLYFIDLGSFQDNGITGEFLVGSTLYEKLDRNAFKQGYRAAGGSEFLFDNERFLGLLHQIKISGYHLRAYYKLPFYDWGKKRSRIKRAQWMLDKLKSQVSGS